jgi:hypothetical protein
MSIKDILSVNKDEPKEYYWAIVIEPGWVQAGVWKINEDKVQIISSSPSTAWELEEELVSAVDTALSSSVQNFPEEGDEPSKAVFGVVSAWVSKGEISEEYIGKIKEVCSELSLTPVGFVVLPEAISHFIKSEEGSPLNGCVLGISKEELEISVFRLGKLIGTTSVARSLSIVDDVTEGLVRFSQDGSLPSRFILYDGKEGEIDEVKQTLLKANWDDVDKVKFLHTPKIESFSPREKIDAVSLAGASELENVTSVDKSENETGASLEKDKDVENVVATDEVLSAQELGFAVGKDITTIGGTKEPTKTLKEEPEEDKIDKPGMQSEPELEVGNKTKFRIFDPKKFFGRLNLLKEMLFNKFVMSKKKAEYSTSKKTLSYGIVFFTFLIIGVFCAWWFYPKATVLIYLSTKKQEERVDITIDPGLSSPNLSEKIIPGELLTTSLSGDKTKSTSGTKTVGEKAKGEVTLYRVGSQVNLEEGIIIVGPNNFEFTLDNDVVVASGSAGTPGTSKVNVTALDIGAEFNLAGGSNFSVRNYSTSDVEAKNESAFSGGTSREISAVSAEDQKSLEEELVDELSEKASSQLRQSLSLEKDYIEETFSATSSAKTFSNKVGDEASTLKLSLTLDTKAIAIKNDDLFELSKEALKDKIPEGYVLRNEQVETEFDFLKVEGGVYEVRTKVTANLLPEVNSDNIKEKIIGKYPKVVENYLKSEIPGFSRAEITFNKPRFPGRLGTLPHVANHLDVEITGEK